MQSHELNKFFYFGPKAPRAIGYATTPSIAQEDRNGPSEQNIECASTPESCKRRAPPFCRIRRGTFPGKQHR